MKFLTNWRAQRGKFFKYIIGFSWVFLQKFLTTRNKLARAARKIFEYMIDLSSFYKEILNNGRAQRGKIFKYIIDLSWFSSGKILTISLMFRDFS